MSRLLDRISDLKRRVERRLLYAPPRTGGGGLAWRVQNKKRIGPLLDRGFCPYKFSMRELTKPVFYRIGLSARRVAFSFQAALVESIKHRVNRFNIGCDDCRGSHIPRFRV
jgi:hypothetical protein